MLLAFDRVAGVIIIGDGFVGVDTFGTSLNSESRNPEDLSELHLHIAMKDSAAVPEHPRQQFHRQKSSRSPGCSSLHKDVSLIAAPDACPCRMLRIIGQRTACSLNG